ncbi:adenine deaminase [Falsibacillus pallidus]|uniref:Adenine deaminase n=1 Tax=Falsibacillus pallidus TaxID=493781 RepID=A0A370GWF6_9BACI|nr:adenine deaminase [Falsibacillus pallidus]RDI47998.1 adenine deaminase [Falsibacillus pallidus]
MDWKKRKELIEVKDLLAQTAIGKRPADMVIQNGRLVNVYTKEILDGMDIAITEGRIAFIGNADHTIGTDTKVIEAADKFLVPGLLDGHMHVESTMLSVTEFSKAALVKGTTGIFMDPHEIANVFGMEGVKLMHDEGGKLPLKVFTTIPSCVPATLDLEDAGASLGVENIKEGLTWERTAGLGEVMNFPGVVYGDSLMSGEISATLAAGKTVTGHFPSTEERMLQAYMAAGVTSDHETVAKEDGLAKLRAGMHLMIREGSAWQDVKEVIKVVTEDGVNTENISLVTDDVYPQTLVEKGHLNHVVRRAIEEGVDPVEAISMATISPARYFHMEKDIGSLAPGKCADILIMEDLKDMVPSTVICDGEVVVENGAITIDFPQFDYPAHIKDSVRLKRKLTPEDFRLKSKYQKENTKVNVIKAIENSARTVKMEAELSVVEGIIKPDIEQDIIRLACIERHKGSGEISNAFVHGFQLKKGAVASTVAHDSHNLIVMGTNEEDMAFAANSIAEIRGGMIVVEDGKIIGKIPMPIAGLMSDKPLEQVVEEARGLEEAWKQLGCSLHAPFMTFSLIALPVIPEIRITNRGLANVNEFSLIDIEI